MFLHKTNALITAATTTNDHQFDLNNVHIKNNTMYASNGACLFSAPVLANNDNRVHDYPGNDTETAEPEELYVPAQAIDKAVRNLPKNGSISMLREYVHIVATDDRINLHTTDLDTFDTVTTKNKTKGYDFPEVDRILGYEPEATNENHFNVQIKELERLVKIYKKAGVKLVHIKHKDNKSPVFIAPMIGDKDDFQCGIKAVVMPFFSEYYSKR